MSCKFSNAEPLLRQPFHPLLMRTVDFLKLNLHSFLSCINKIGAQWSDLKHPGEGVARRVEFLMHRLNTSLWRPCGGEEGTRSPLCCYLASSHYNFFLFMMIETSATTAFLGKWKVILYIPFFFSCVFLWYSFTFFNIFLFYFFVIVWSEVGPLFYIMVWISVFYFIISFNTSDFSLI